MSAFGAKRTSLVAPQMRGQPKNKTAVRKAFLRFSALKNAPV
jgi:hypothetical protein